jgi:hypothetical protein
LKRLNAEKNDFETLKAKLSNMLLGETVKEPTEEKAEEEEAESPAKPANEPANEPTNEPLDTALPEPPKTTEPVGESPVVVYVRNAEQQTS